MWMEKLRVIRGAFGTVLVSRVLVWSQSVGTEVNKKNVMPDKGGSSEQHRKAGEQSHKNSKPEAGGRESGSSKSSGSFSSKSGSGSGGRGGDRKS